MIKIFREFTVCFPSLTGPHTVSVTYDGVPVPNSPFRVNVTEGCHPSRVKAQGPGLKEAFTNQPNAFSVVTRYLSLLDLSRISEREREECNGLCNARC